LHVQATALAQQSKKLPRKRSPKLELTSRRSEAKSFDDEALREIVTNQAPSPIIPILGAKPASPPDAEDAYTEQQRLTGGSHLAEYSAPAKKTPSAVLADPMNRLAVVLPGLKDVITSPADRYHGRFSAEEYRKEVDKLQVLVNANVHARLFSNMPCFALLTEADPFHFCI